MKLQIGNLTKVSVFLIIAVVVILIVGIGHQPASASALKNIISNTDAGAYLIELGKWEDAIPWLEEATTAPRYSSPEFPYMNLGRVYEHLGEWHLALTYYNRALTSAPMYLPAEWAKNALLGRLN